MENRNQLNKNSGVFQEDSQNQEMKKNELLKKQNENNQQNWKNNKLKRKYLKYKNKEEFKQELQQQLLDPYVDTQIYSREQDKFFRNRIVETKNQGIDEFNDSDSELIEQDIKIGVQDLCEEINNKSPNFFKENIINFTFKKYNHYQESEQNLVNAEIKKNQKMEQNIQENQEREKFLLGDQSTDKKKNNRKRRYLKQSKSVNSTPVKKKKVSFDSNSMTQICSAKKSDDFLSSENSNSCSSSVNVINFSNKNFWQQQQNKIFMNKTISFNNNNSLDNNKINLNQKLFQTQLCENNNNKNINNINNSDINVSQKDLQI